MAHITTNKVLKGTAFEIGIQTFEEIVGPIIETVEKEQSTDEIIELYKGLTVGLLAWIFSTIDVGRAKNILMGEIKDMEKRANEYNNKNRNPAEMH